MSKDKTREYACKYSDVPTDAMGWVTDLNYLPIAFDMMQLRIHNKDKIIPGWWDERRWTGLRFKRGYKVTQWKRMPEYD